MKKNTKIIALLAVAVLCVAVLASCSTSSLSVKTDEKTTTITASNAGTDMKSEGSFELDEKTAKTLDCEKLTAGMRDAVAYGQEKGVRVCMEDVDQANYPTSTIAGLRAFLDRIPGLECCFDTGNWIMSGEDEVEAFKKTQDRISAMHLKDRSKTRINEDDIEIRLPDGSELYPAPVGKGYIRVAEILSMAGDWPVIAELYNCSPARMLEGIRASVEWIAAQIRT